MIYADYNATSPLSPAISEAMQPFLAEYFVNPSAMLGRSGKVVSRAVDKAREQIATLLDAEPEEVVFVSGGT